MLGGRFLSARGLGREADQSAVGISGVWLAICADAAITRYLAAFLTVHRHVAMEESDAAADHDPARPDVVLFNGGVFESPLLRGRLLEVLESWFTRNENSSGTRLAAAGTAAQQPDRRPTCRRPLNRVLAPIVLDNDRLDLAVARGAAYYGMVRRGQGVRIAAGLARTYYIGVEATTSPAAPEPLSPDRSPGAFLSCSNRHSMPSVCCRRESSRGTTSR